MKFRTREYPKAIHSFIHFKVRRRRREQSVRTQAALDSARKTNSAHRITLRKTNVAVAALNNTQQRLNSEHRPASKQCRHSRASSSTAPCSRSLSFAHISSIVSARRLTFFPAVEKKKHHVPTQINTTTTKSVLPEFVQQQMCCRHVSSLVDQQFH